MSKFEVKCIRPGCGQGVETPDIDEVMAWSAAHDEACPALKAGGSGESAERHDEPMYELSEGGSTLRVYLHDGAELDDFLTVKVNGPADSVRLSWGDAVELSDTLRDAIGMGTFKEDALREAEKRGAEKATAKTVMGGQWFAVVWALREAAKDWRRNGLAWGDPDEETNTDLLVARKLDERADRIERGEQR